MPWLVLETCCYRPPRLTQEWSEWPVALMDTALNQTWEAFGNDLSFEITATQETSLSILQVVLVSLYIISLLYVVPQEKHPRFGFLGY